MMDIGPYSKKRVYETFGEWRVPQEFAHSLYNYLVYGFAPGGCFTSILANDWHLAIMRSHPSNTIEALKAATGWIHDYVPQLARGSYDAVDAWCRLDDDARKAILLERDLVLSDKTETIKSLKGESTSVDHLLHYFSG